MVKTCVNCNEELTGNKKKYCSNKCKCKFFYKNNSQLLNQHAYAYQKEIRTERKDKLINMHGGKCEICGYNKNTAALCLHHDPTKGKKLFRLKLSNLNNHSWADIVSESNKCQLLCHNCHGELHHPHLDMDKLI